MVGSTRTTRLLQKHLLFQPVLKIMQTIKEAGAMAMECDAQWR